METFIWGLKLKPHKNGKIHFGALTLRPNLSSCSVETSIQETFIWGLKMKPQNNGKIHFGALTLRPNLSSCSVETPI